MHRKAQELAIGRWRGILAALGIDPVYLTGWHTPCPICGGKDRFRFDDKGGRGTFFCSHCGAGDGFSLLQRFHDWNFRTAAQEVEQVTGTNVSAKVVPSPRDYNKLKVVERAWSQARPLYPGDEAMLYLERRGLASGASSDALRLHPGMPYRNGEDYLGVYAALLALVTGPDNRIVTVHRTYLQAGRKAPVLNPRKLMPGGALRGAAIRLHPAGEVLGVAEGIETALAARQLFGFPVWSCVSAVGMEAFVPPGEVKKLIVFGDHDASGTGQAAAWSLAKKLIPFGLDVQVQIPGTVGTDWADVLLAASVTQDDQ